jgi:hypothetical protein
MAINASQEKARIDRGDYGDKVPGFDPAAAPLGTDEEAAGTPPPAIEPRRTAARPPAGQTPSPEDSIAPNADPAKPRGNWWPAAVVVTVLVAIVIAGRLSGLF